MKLHFSAFALIVSVSLANATECTGMNDQGGEYSVLLPRSDPNPFRHIFPSIRSASIPDKPATATLHIGSEDCRATDLPERKHKAEALIGQPVRLVLDDRDYVIKPLSSGRIDVRSLKAILPTLRLRADKIGEEAEILFVGAADMSAVDINDRLAKLQALVGKPVYLRIISDSL